MSGSREWAEAENHGTVAAWGAAMCQMIVVYQHDRPLRAVYLLRVDVAVDDRHLLQARAQESRPDHRDLALLAPL